MYVSNLWSKIQLQPAKFSLKLNLPQKYDNFIKLFEIFGGSKQKLTTGPKCGLMRSGRVRPFKDNSYLNYSFPESPAVNLLLTCTGNLLSRV